MALYFHIPDSALGGIDEYTKLMLHADGADNGEIFTDDSASNHTVTRSVAVTKTGEKQFGTAAGYFDGTGYLTVPASSDWNFGTDDFTIDFWNYAITNSPISKVNGAIFHTDDTVNYIGIYTSKSNSKVFTSIRGTYAQYDAPILNVWTHYAVVRYNGQVYMYQNGTELGNYAYATSMDFSSYGVNIGIDMWANYITGYVDELRVSNGIARWTTDFIPESSPYTE